MASLLMEKYLLHSRSPSSSPLLKQGNGDELHSHDWLCVFPQLHTD